MDRGRECQTWFMKRLVTMLGLLLFAVGVLIVSVPLLSSMTSIAWTVVAIIVGLIVATYQPSGLPGQRVRKGSDVPR
jgi:hypothetical protein